MNEFKLNLSSSDMQVLHAALIELPFRISAPLIEKINVQIQQAHDQAVDAKDLPTGA